MSKDTVGEFLALTAQRLRRFACGGGGGWFASYWPCKLTTTSRKSESRRDEESRVETGKG